jgi:hypothetical protein
LRVIPDQEERGHTYMNGTVIIGIVSVMIEATIAAIRLIKEQKSTKKTK